MTQKNLFPTVTSSQEDTHVSRSVSQESKKRMKMTATSGRTCMKLLHAKDPLMQFSKMFMVTLDWASTRCSLTWKPKATPQGRLLFQLLPSTLPIEETDCGLWPTPTARDWKGGRKPETLKAKGRPITNSLPDAVRGELWPTPTARDYKGQNSLEHLMRDTRHHTQLPNRLKLMGINGQLNPTWVEWLMGYPEGWTELED